MKRLVFAMLAVLMLLPATALAKDRNKDGLPDRWERKNHLSLKVDQARRDQDRDGVRNRAEYKHGTSPRDEDSDDDGTEDSEEAGKVKSFSAADGTLVIALLNGDDVSGKVTDATEIECEASDDGSARVSSNDEDSDEGDEEGLDDDADTGEDDDADTGEDGDTDTGDDEGEDEGDDDESDHDEDCGTEALTPGALVHEAELEISGSGGAVWQEIELIG